MMRKTFHLILFLLCFSGEIFAQTVSLEQILATSLNDERVTRDAQMEQFTNNLNFNLPPVKKIELRLGLNGNNTSDTLDGNLRNEDYYSLNLTTNKLKEMKLQKQIKPAQVNLFNKEKEMFQMQAIQDRYTVLTSLYYNTEALKKKKELQDLLNKKNELLQNLLNEGITIKINDALDTEKDLVLVFNMIQEEENAITINKAKLCQFFSTSKELFVDFKGMITPKKIIANNILLKQDSINQHPSVIYKEAQYQLAAANNILERAQNTNVLNSFQVGYNRPVYTSEILKKFKPENTLTFRVGISIPIMGNYNFNRNNTNIQQYNALLNWQTSQVIQDKTINVQESRFENSIRQYNALIDIYSKSIISRLLENEKVVAQSTALELIDMRIAKKKIEINMLLSAGTLTQNYIQLLENKGLLNYSTRSQYLLE